MTLLLVFGAFTLSFSFLCSVLEAVILTVPPSYVASIQHTKRRTGRLLHRLKEDIDRPLAAILTLNTIANTAGAALVGNQARAVFESTWVGVTTGVLVLLVLIFSEIIPKTLGATCWRRLVTPAAWVIQWLIVAMYPMVMLANRIASLIARGQSVAQITRSEIHAIANLGHREGVIDEDESRIIESVMRFAALAVRDVMTPRPVVVALDESQTLAEAANADLRPSRILIYRDSVDSVTGYVLSYELLLGVARGEGDHALASLRRDILPLPDGVPLREAFSKMLGGNEHIALVVDQYGGTAGVVTVEDIVETLLGLEIVDETDRATDMQELARRQWARRARRLGLAVEGGTSTEPAAGEQATDNTDDPAAIPEEAAEPEIQEEQERP